MLALVIAEPGPSAQELDRALREDGFAVEHSAPARLTARSDGGTPPDLVLASASLGPRRLALLSRSLTVGGLAPTVVVFPEGDFTALESCVRGGFDYVMPPYLPSLLRSRLAFGWERRRLTLNVEEMATAAGQREHESIAQQIQSGFLPEELPIPERWEVGARFEPARWVGGDFYDVFELVNGRRLGLVVADVCDRGVEAAMFMALIRTLVRHTAKHTSTCSLLGDAPAPMDGAALSPPLSISAGPLLQAVAGTNRYLVGNHLREGYFATMFFGVLDPVSGRLLYINAGHNPPALVHTGGYHQLLHPTGPAVGILADSGYSLGHVALEPDDTLLMYTDGVIGARNAEGEPFGMDRMLSLAAEPGRTAEEMLSAVEDAVRRYSGVDERSDDIAMLALRRRPA